MTDRLPIRRNICFKQGFTLAEILVALTIGVLLIATLSQTQILSSRTYRRSVNHAELTQNARIALERISRDLRQSERIVTTLPLNDDDILNPAPHEIKFQDGHDSNQVHYIRYYLSGSNLRRQLIHYYFSTDPTVWVTWNTQDQFGNLPEESVDEDVIKADKISNIKFYGDKVISIELTVANGDSSFEFFTKVLGRNIQ